MCGGRARVVALLEKLQASDVDVSRVSGLPGYVNLINTRNKKKLSHDNKQSNSSSSSVDQNKNKEINKKKNEKNEKKSKENESEKIINNESDGESFDSKSTNNNNNNNKNSDRNLSFLNSFLQSSYALPIVLLSIILGTIHHYQIHTHNGFTKFWLWWENVDLYAEQVCHILIFIYLLTLSCLFGLFWAKGKLA